MVKSKNITNWFVGDIEVGELYLTNVYFSLEDRRINVIHREGIDHPTDGIRLGVGFGRMMSFDEFFEKYPEFFEKVKFVENND